ncbi:MAG: ABC transporter ATP-binding protein [Anaerolineales bacterium]|nr:ABC transporter ATP-binding protein [Anaerolineales bacterium]
MTTAISVERLSKTYRLGQIGTGTFAHDLNLWWARMRGKPNPLLRIGDKDHGNRDSKEIWALKDVNFKVEQGEVLGIIGRNGAGKSTLLKILSRVTAPTSGRIKVKGRIASLLEVGTGFHPDLTGRENTYLNGAILGMSRREIDRKFDEIVDFSGVEKFIDTPVKRYSSGMYVRLAFAVAAHLEPEILVVDEVLAVGDAEFQKKCLGKMGSVAKEGRTVLFVSHNITAINQLCRSALWINKGQIVALGETKTITTQYLDFQFTNENEKTISIKHTQDEIFQLTDVKINGATAQDSVINSAAPVEIDLTYEIHKITNGLRIGFDLYARDGSILLRSFDDDIDTVKRSTGTFLAQARIPPNLLNEGKYYIDIAVGIHGVRWILWHDVTIRFEILSAGKINRNYAGGKHPGYFLVDADWKTLQLP